MCLGMQRHTHITLHNLAIFLRRLLGKSTFSFSVIVSLEEINRDGYMYKAVNVLGSVLPTLE